MNRSFSSCCNGRVYSNNGNKPLIEMLSGPVRCVLDVGCGDGANARLVRKRYPEVRIDGITVSSVEQEIAALHFENLWLFDIENTENFPMDFSEDFYDAIIFSHVFEHLKFPEKVLAHMVRLLKPEGQVLIAVPNILGWKQRISFLFGKFEYDIEGVLDNTHLRFFTFFTADRYLFSESSSLNIVTKCATGSAPLWLLRRWIFPSSWSAYIDKKSCSIWPNLFGNQILIKALKV